MQKIIIGFSYIIRVLLEFIISYHNKNHEMVDLKLYFFMVYDVIIHIKILY
jgi:hypothetical protein